MTALGRRSAFLLLVFFTCAACTDWPPNKTRLVDNFNENRAAFDELRAQFEETEYPHVLFVPPDEAKTTVSSGEYLHYETIHDGTQWADLFSKANVSTVERLDHGAARFQVLVRFRANQSALVHYINAPGRNMELIECRNEHRRLDCGVCAVPLEEDWWVEVSWWRTAWETDEKLGYVDGEYSSKAYREQYREFADAARAACWREGYAAIGYELENDESRRDSESDIDVP